MALTIPASIAAELTADGPSRITGLLSVGSSLRFTDAPVDVAYNGETYRAGLFAGNDPVRSVRFPERAPVTVTFADDGTGAFSGTEGAAVHFKVAGVPARSGNPPAVTVSHAVTVASGIVVGVTRTADPSAGVKTVTLDVDSAFAAFDAVNPRYMLSEDQKRYSATDTAFDRAYVDDSRVRLWWGRRV